VNIPADVTAELRLQPTLDPQGRPISPSPDPSVGPAHMYILSKLLAEVADNVILGARQYGRWNHHVLGPMGQFADIWRKIGPLRRAMWEGADLPREGQREILMDLIGHCLLAVEMIDNKVPREGNVDAIGERG